MRVITTIAGYGIAGYGGDGGSATEAKLDSPSCLAIDATGNLYINDQRNSCVRKMTTSGVISTVAGTGSAGYNGDGITAKTAKLNLNWGIAMDAAGNMYIADQVNFRVRKVATSGIITTIGGTGTAGFSGDNGPAISARFQSPLGIAVDGSGNVYVGDPNNFRVRKINTAGVVTTVAGNGSAGITGNNVPATATPLGYIWGLSIDASGNLLICDGTNNCIHSVNNAGIINRIAGIGTAGYSGDDGPATDAMLNQPLGVYAHSSGAVYIADYRNERIRKIDAAGIITTIAGTGVKGYNGDDMPATAAQLFRPVSVIVDNADNIYITDLNNVRVRKISTVNILSFTGGPSQSLTMCENTTATTVNELLTITDHNAGATDTWTTIAGPRHGTMNTVYSSVATGGKDMPSGMDYTPYTGYTGHDTITVRAENGTESDTIVIYVTITSAPESGTLSGIEYVCIGSLTQLEASAGGGTWSSKYGNTVVSNGSVLGVITGIDTILYTVTNKCGNATATKAIRVREVPDAGKITGPTAFCNLSMVLLTADLPGGIWSCSNTLAVVDSGRVTGILPGKTTIRYSISDSFCTGVTNYNMTIDTEPDAGIIAAPEQICTGASVAISDNATGGMWETRTGNVSVSADRNCAGITPGTDTIVYRVSNSCGTAIATHPIAVVPVPGTPTITRNMDTCSVQPEYYSYQWQLNGQQLPGATTSTYHVSAPGNYAVIISNSAGCAAASSPVSFPGCSPGEIRIYPNPAADYVYMSWCAEATLKLTTTDGKELKVANHTNRINLSNLPNGTYLLNVYDVYDEKVKTKRITKLSQ